MVILEVCAICTALEIRALAREANARSVVFERENFQRVLHQSEFFNGILMTNREI